MYITRSVEIKLLGFLKHFPAVAILGPRQVGKTTLAKELQNKIERTSLYMDLENPVDASALEHPVEFLRNVGDKTVIIDEIQRKPELFPALRVVIDQRRTPGGFILLGSSTPEFLYMSNETLAGRIAHVELTPFEFSEIEQLADFREHWLRGGFPEPFQIENSEIRQAWFKVFLSAYVERDLKLLGLPTSPSKLYTLLRMISSMQGGLLNASTLAKSLGVSSPTISNVLSFFERSFIIRLLKPWYANLGKRLIKSPKIYIRDSGIINHLLGIVSYEDLLRNPFLGNLWEGYAIENTINTLKDDYQYYFYRTADGTECDMVIFKGHQCLATIDVKFSPKVERTKSMTIAMKDLKAGKGFYLVPDSPGAYGIGNNQYVTTPFRITEIILSMG